MSEAERRGLLYGGLCAGIGAFAPAVARLATERADPVVVAVATTGFAAIAAVAVLAHRGELGQLVRRRDLPALGTVGLLGTAVPFVLFFEGTRRTSAIVAVLCLQAEPVYSLLLSWAAFGHRPTLRRVVAAAVLLGGISLAVGTGDARADATGVALLLAAPPCWQLSHLVSLRRLGHVRPLGMTGARYAYGVLLLLPALAWTGGGAFPPAGAWLELLAFFSIQGVVIGYLGTVAWYAAIARLDLARATAIIVPSIPVLSLAASAALVGEVPTARQALGMGLTVGGVLAFVRAPAPRS